MKPLLLNTSIRQRTLQSQVYSRDLCPSFHSQNHRGWRGSLEITASNLNSKYKLSIFFKRFSVKPFCFVHNLHCSSKGTSAPSGSGGRRKSLQHLQTSFHKAKESKKVEDLPSFVLETFHRSPSLLYKRNQRVPKELVAMVASHKSSIIVCYYEGDSLIKRFAFWANFKIFVFLQTSFAL